MKTLIQIDNVSKHHGARAVLDNASVTIGDNQKIGVIGRNGAGKSTLCKIIVGEEQQDSGKVHKTKDLRLAYLEQHDPYKMDELVGAFLSRYTGKEEWECGKIAAQFEITNDILYTPIGELPGGFRTRVKLASMLLRDPNLLILDEPTNYLDLKTLILLEEFLQGFRGGFMIVSHDREFLKKTCTETLEIENGECTLYPGNVEEFLLFKEEQARLVESHNKTILAKRKHLQNFIDRFGATASKAGQARSMMKKMERLETIDTGHSLHNVRIDIPNIPIRNAPAFSCDDLAVGYPDKIVAKNISMHFNQGDHVAILGDNGQGKTTFMRTLANDLEPKGGEFKWSKGLRVGYYAQHVVSQLDPRDDVYSHLSRMADKSVMRQDILNLAGCFLFKGDDIEKKVKILSGGEKARLCLAGLLLSKHDILLLDEPTNHLDFETVEALGEGLKNFNGTLFFISHDRTFVNMLATQIIEVDNGSIIRYPGTYEEYVYRMEQNVWNELDEENQSEKPKVKAPKPPDPEKEKAKLEQEARRQAKAEKARLESRIKHVQEKLERHKKEHDDILKSFETDPATWSIERNSRFEYLANAIKKEEEEWLSLTDQLEKLRSAH